MRAVVPPPPPSAGRFPSSTSGFLEAVAEPADGRDHVCAELLADSRDEYLDRVRIPIEVLVVDMLDKLGAADRLALVVHEIGEELVLLGGELHRLAVPSDLPRTGVEPDVAGRQLGACNAGGPANESAKARDQLFGLEGFG